MEYVIPRLASKARLCQAAGVSESEPQEAHREWRSRSHTCKQSEQNQASCVISSTPKWHSCMEKASARKGPKPRIVRRRLYSIVWKGLPELPNHVARSCKGKRDGWRNPTRCKSCIYSGRCLFNQAIAAATRISRCSARCSAPSTAERTSDATSGFSSRPEASGSGPDATLAIPVQ
jgi:hypothetical protein